MSDPINLQALVRKGSAEGREVALVRLMSLLGKDSCSLGNVLVHAATAGDAEVLSMLLAAAAKPEELVLTSMEASTARIPLMAAAGGGHLAAVKELLAHAPQQQLAYSTMQAQGTGGHQAVTALHEAAAHGNTEVLSVLLATSSQPEQLVMARNQAEHTPLMMAASAGNTSCCQALMQYNPDQQLAATSRDHCLALHLSVMHGHDETAALLLSHNPRPQVLKLSVGHKTPLHYAVSSGSVACVRLLLEHHPQEQVELNDVEGQVRKKERMAAPLQGVGFGLGISANGAARRECAHDPCLYGGKTRCCCEDTGYARYACSFARAQDPCPKWAGSPGITIDRG